MTAEAAVPAGTLVAPVAPVTPAAAQVAMTKQQIPGATKMTDKNPLAHYGGVLSEAVQESAAADVPASGAAALSQYLKDCEQHSIVPDVGGAFAFAFAAGFNLATTQAAPIAWPKDAQDVRDFFRSDFITAQFPAQDQAPCDEDRYLIIAHDFLSAVNWWADFPHVPREPQAAPAAVAVLDDLAVPTTWMLVEDLVQAECNKARLHQEYMGKAMPADVYQRFQRTRDELVPALRSEVYARLAATPAAAAPVVLPEPVAWRHSRTYDLHDTEDEVQLADGDEHAQPLFTEQQVLAMLAGVSAPAAQSEPVAWPHVEIGLVALEWKRQKRLFPVLSKDGWMDQALNNLRLAHTSATPQAQEGARDAAPAASEQDALQQVRQAVRDFHYALDSRTHGGVAAGAAMNAIEMALNMYWHQGQEADRRAAIAAQAAQQGGAA